MLMKDKEGSLGIGLTLIGLLVLACVCLWSSSYSKDSDGTHKFHIHRRTSFCCPSGRYICCKPGDWNEPNREAREQPTNIPKGHTSLSWIMRVQIALDAARGLEYIHEHTKPHYVHRDIKTSNILVDNFGLAKLVAKTNDAEASVTRVVGSFGYVAPEYSKDGLATSKRKDAITRTEGTTGWPGNKPISLKFPICFHILHLYPSCNTFFDMIHICRCILAKQCMDDDPILSPDMKWLYPFLRSSSPRSSGKQHLQGTVKYSVVR
ncbi:hypothetical protein Leryth_021392 [Lithospermum erythrorhizon]|nr:hypothetical protein Leryth_021392 [Lithospermum erythrorhizon]